MFKLLRRFQAKNSTVDGFHPETPVKPKKPVQIDQIEIFRPEHFPQHQPEPWLDREDAQQSVLRLFKKGQLNKADAELCYKWIKDGYVTIEGLIDSATIDAAWVEYEQAIADEVVHPGSSCSVNGLPGRYLNTHFKVDRIEALLKDPRITRIISMLMGAKSLPFQTITGHNGSEQLEHSDAIHMTTYPMDFLAAAWIAFEDIDPASGPLVYYPGSHRLPHFLSKEADIGIDEFKTNGYTAYREKYEPGLQKIIQEHQLEAKYFQAKKGDVLIWHSNLIHGGSKRQNLQLSRNALVCHYFAEGCICYHDLAAGLAHIHL